MRAVESEQNTKQCSPIPPEPTPCGTRSMFIVEEDEQEDQVSEYSFSKSSNLLRSRQVPASSSLEGGLTVSKSDVYLRLGVRVGAYLTATQMAEENLVLNGSASVAACTQDPVPVPSAEKLDNLLVDDRDFEVIDLADQFPRDFYELSSSHQLGRIGPSYACGDQSVNSSAMTQPSVEKGRAGRRRRVIVMAAVVTTVVVVLVIIIVIGKKENQLYPANCYQLFSTDFISLFKRNSVADLLTGQLMSI